MAQEYLPAPSNIRLADLMKEHNISQPELAKEIGCSKSTISRFISGARTTPATAYRPSVSAQNCARTTTAITLKPPTTSICPVAAGCGVL